MDLDYKKIAMNVRVGRARANLSIEELAKKSGVAMCTISFIENAKRTVRLGTLEKIASALGMTLEELIY